MPIVRTIRPPAEFCCAPNTCSMRARILLLASVRSRLRIRQRMVAAGAPVNTAVKAAGLELRLALGRAIGAVGEHICRGVALGQERVDRLAVVYRRIGHL